MESAASAPAKVADDQHWGPGWHGATCGPAKFMSPDPLIFRELSMIHQIISDETWLEGERRGCRVSSDDPVVRESVCTIILRIGQQLRDSLSDLDSPAA